MFPAQGDNSTSLSLLNRARRNDVDAWGRLTALYSPIVYSWCRRAGLQDTDAADVVQEVFRLVFQGLAQFRGAERSGGSFRGWLWTISRNQVRLNFRNRGNRPQPIGGTDAQIRFAEQADGSGEDDDDEFDDDDSGFDDDDEEFDENADAEEDDESFIEDDEDEEEGDGVGDGTDDEEEDEDF